MEGDQTNFKMIVNFLFCSYSKRLSSGCGASVELKRWPAFGIVWREISGRKVGIHVGKQHHEDQVKSKILFN